MRIFFAIVAILSAFVAPPAITLICMIVLSVRYAAWEVLFIGFLVDCLWFTPSGVGGFIGFIPLFTLVGIILVWGLEPLRKEFLLR